MNADIAKRIIAIRKSKRMTQTQFAERLNTTRPKIAAYELNKVNFDYAFLDYICKIFDISYEWLMTGAGEMLSKTKQSFVERFSAEVGLSGYAKKILECYLGLDENQRAVMDVFFKSIGDALSTGQSSEGIDVDTAIETASDRRHFMAAKNSTNPKAPQLIDRPPEFMGRVEKAPDVNDTGDI